MLIKLKSRLETIQEMIKEKDPEVTDYTSGTLAIIEGSFDFHKTDGFITFLLMALDYIPTAYGKQEGEWEERLHRIAEMAEKLKDKDTRFTGSTKKDFEAYCRNLPRILQKEPVRPIEHIIVPKLTVIETLNLVPVMEEHIHAGHKLGFHYTGHVEPADIIYDLMDQLSGLKLEKTGRKYDISNFLTTTGYHEHVHDALNILIQCGVYAINCSSTKKREARSFDVAEVDNKLQYAELIVKRIKHLV